jgi:hypothetical protein
MSESDKEELLREAAVCKTPSVGGTLFILQT